MITMDFVIGVISLVATIFGIGYSVGYNQGKYHAKNNTKK